MEREIAIREGGPSDHHRAASVIRETFDYHLHALPHIFRATDDPPPTEVYIDDLVSSGSGAFLLAEHEGTPVGIATVRLLETREVSFLVARRWAQVETLGVLERWRGHGVGRKLMNACEEWALGRGTREVQLTVWAFNLEAMQFYRTLGYAPGNHMLQRRLP